MSPIFCCTSMNVLRSSCSSRLPLSDAADSSSSSQLKSDFAAGAVAPFAAGAGAPVAKPRAGAVASAALSCTCSMSMTRQLSPSWIKAEWRGALH